MIGLGSDKNTEISLNLQKWIAALQSKTSLIRKMYKSHFQRPCKHRIVYFCHLDIEEDEEYQNLKLKFTFFGGFPFHNIERILKRVKRLPKSIYRHRHTLHCHIQILNKKLKNNKTTTTINQTSTWFGVLQTWGFQLVPPSILQACFFVKTWRISGYVDGMSWRKLQF